MRIGPAKLSESASIALRASAIVWALGYAMVIGAGGFLTERTTVPDVLVNMPLWVLAMAQSGLIYLLWGRLQRRPAVVRWPVAVGACLAAAALQTTIDLNTYYWLGQTILPEWSAWATLSTGRVGGAVILYTWTFILNLIVYWAIGLSEQAREQGRRAAEAEAATERAEFAAQRAQLAALRLQLNPHFLFNTLNAISTLVMERDCDRADQMLDRLSDFLRASLSMDPTALIRLGEELDAVQAYLEIEEVRFEGRLRVTIECPEALRMQFVPGFLLQPLVENAVKYAVAPALRPVQVVVSASLRGDDLVLRVVDDGDPVDPGRAITGAGVGLANTRARVASLYGARGEVSAGRQANGFVAEVRLPAGASAQKTVPVGVVA
ncbi:MAG: histidine kinase [Pseudomonadota bacterium]